MDLTTNNTASKSAVSFSMDSILRKGVLEDEDSEVSTINNSSKGECIVRA
jgi:hypothetical protein